MGLIKTNNGRLRIDPGIIVSVETCLVDPAYGESGRIILEGGKEIICNTAEAETVVEQWETWFATQELDPPDDDQDDDDDDDDGPDGMQIPETIDLRPSRKLLRRGGSRE